MSLQEIAIEDIYISETAAQEARRKHFNKQELEELVTSIAEFGVLQPIIVRARPAAGGYTHELVAGERRFLAADEAGLKKIPAVVRELTDEQVLEVQLIENLQRKDLHPMQEAEGYHELMEKHGHTADELADRLGKSKAYVYGRLKLLALCKQAREAFYSDAISASVALLIARIPGDKLQEQALRDLTGYDEQVSYRRAAQIIQENYMLRLKGAPFPVNDPDLHKQAGPCSSCPKRTGNQPELFGDIESADVCTDPVCFGVKRREHGARLIKAAKAEGRQVIAGPEAKKIMPYGNSSNYLNGYARLDSTVYDLPGNKKVRSVIGKDAAVALLQVPSTGEVVEIVKDSVLKAAVRKVRKESPGASNVNSYAAEQRKRQQQAKIEKKVRYAIFAAVRPSLQAPSMREIAQFVLGELDYERREILCKVLELTPVEKRGTAAGKWQDVTETLEQHVAQLPDDQLPIMLRYMLLAQEFVVHSYNIGKPERLLAAAAAAGVDVKAIRKEVTPKPKKKASKKKTARKSSSKGTA